MINKKGSVSMTISWFGATLLVFFILLVHIFVVGLISSSSRAFSSSDYKIDFKGFNDIQIIREFYSFLNSKTIFEGKEIRIIDLIADKTLPDTSWSNLSKYNKLTEENQKYFEEFQTKKENFLGKFSSWRWFGSNGFATFDSVYGSSFVRLYDSSEESEQYISVSNKYSHVVFAVDSQSKMILAEPCNPNENSIFFESFFSKDKKIAFCMEYIE
jgi:hypothetical protein